MIELVTGGSGSGKSEYAERRAARLCGGGTLIYLAAMKPYGEEGKKRVARHRKLREGKGFVTVERYTDYADLEIPPNATALLECLSNLVANEMFDAGGCYIKRVTDGVLHLADTCENLVIVTNEVFSDGICYEGDTETYKRALAEVNKRIAAMADVVCEVACAVPNIIKSPEGAG